MTKKQPKIEDKIKELEAQITELKSGWQRTQADFENFRKRTQLEKLDLIKSASCDLMLKILPVIDNFELALKHKPSSLCHSERPPRAYSGQAPGVEESLSENKRIPKQVRDDNNLELQKISNYILGLEHIKSQLSEILKYEGLTPIEVKPGDQFDPNFHEALSSEKSDKFSEGQIVEVVENGYKFGDRVLKPTKVKVAT